MGLQAQAPLRVLHAVLDGLFGVGQAGGAVHGLQEEVVEVQVFEARGQGVGLGVDQLEFVAAFDDDGAVPLGLTQIQSMPGAAGRCRWFRWRR